VISVKLSQPQFRGARPRQAEFRHCGNCAGVHQSSGWERSSSKRAGGAERSSTRRLDAAKNGPRRAARGAGFDAAAKGAARSGGLPGKLGGFARSGIRTVAELFFWWRANRQGGTAEAGARRRFQAILPLKGKNSNVRKSALRQDLAQRGNPAP